MLRDAGTVTSSAAPTRDITVQLFSGDLTEVTVPATVILHAGETSATFSLTIIDDTLIDDTQTATITAHVENWTEGSANIDILDNDRFLAVLIPESAWEGQVTTGTVFIGGTLESDLVVSLASNDSSELTVPATVTIPAGQMSYEFNLTLVPDSEHDGVQTAMVTASATDFTDATDTIVVHDGDLDHYAWDPISSPQIGMVAFPVMVRAENVEDETIPVYAGSANLSGAGSEGPVPMTPATCSFASGIWADNVTVNALATGVVLTVDDALGHTGSSNPFDVIHGPLDHFQWSTIASPSMKTCRLLPHLLPWMPMETR